MGQSQKTIISKTKACPKCGSKVSVKAKFCTSCGTKIEATKADIPRIAASSAERLQKEKLYSDLKTFLDFSANPDKQKVEDVFKQLELNVLSEQELREVLLPLLEHPYKLIREKTAFVLAQDEAGIKTMLEILEGEPAWLRSTAVKALGRVKAKKAIPALLHIYERSKDLWLKQDILLAFGEIADPQPFNTIARAISEKEPELIKAAAVSLKAIGDPAAVQYLIPGLEHPEQKVVETITESIQSFGKRSVGMLVKKLLDTNSSEMLRSRILELLNKVPDPMAVPLLINILNQEPHLAIAVIKIMGSWKYDEFVPVLEKLKESNERACRLEADVALKQIKEKP